MTPTIPLDLFARTRALLDRGVSIDEALGSAGLDWPTWLSIEETWLTALADDAERGKVESLEAFSRAYASEIKAVGAPMDVPPAGPPPVAVLPELPVAPPSLPLEPDPYSASSPISHALPAPATASPWAAQAAPTSKKHAGFQTAALDLAMIAAAAKALPFKKPTTGEITSLDLSEAGGRGPALPFREAPPEGVALSPKVSTSVSEEHEERLTQLNLAAVDSEDTLPFIPTRSKEGQTPLPSGPTGTEPTLVALRDPPQPAPSISLETYAALAAALLREGHAVAAVFRRFNTTAEAFRAAETYYEPRIKTDAEMSRRFSEAYFLASMPKSR